MNTEDGETEERGIVIVPLGVDVSARDRAELAELLMGCVGSGASIRFLAPLAPAEADAYWEKTFGDLSGGFRVLLVVRKDADGVIIGSAQLACESRANGRHRAEVQKVMVRPSHRRRGIAARLMHEIERVARSRGVTLLLLDTGDSHSGARQLYVTTGYVYVGGIPGYALDPRGTPEKNAIFYKTLASP